jgi:lysozyme
MIQCQGIDVSGYNKNVNWAQVASSGICFAFIKSTEGITYINPNFKRDWEQSKQAGVIRGSYHFFHASVDPQVQAKYFLSTIGTLGPTDLPPVLDWELHGPNRQQEISNALMWLEIVHSATNKVPIIYTGRYFIGDLGNPQALAKYTLWLAEYASQPTIPKPWSEFSFWQYSESGSVPGVSEPCDLNMSYGDMTWLQGFINQSSQGVAGVN